MIPTAVAASVITFFSISDFASNNCFASVTIPETSSCFRAIIVSFTASLVCWTSTLVTTVGAVETTGIEGCSTGFGGPAIAGISGVTTTDWTASWVNCNFFISANFLSWASSNVLFKKSIFFSALIFWSGVASGLARTVSAFVISLLIWPLIIFSLILIASTTPLISLEAWAALAFSLRDVASFLASSNCLFTSVILSITLVSFVFAAWVINSFNCFSWFFTNKSASATLPCWTAKRADSLILVNKNLPASVFSNSLRIFNASPTGLFAAKPNLILS